MKLARWSIEPLVRDERGKDEQLLLRAAAAGLPSPFFAERLPLGSKVRKAMLTRAVRTGFAALNRRDMEVLLTAYTPDFEMDGGATPWAGFGIGPVYRGEEGYRQMLAAFEEGFESTRMDPREIVDAGGDRFSCRADLIGTARGGMVTRQDLWSVYRTRGGRVASHHVFTSEEEALEALTDAADATG